MHSKILRLVVCGLVVVSCADRPSDDDVASTRPDTIPTVLAQPEASPEESLSDPWLQAGAAIQYLPVDSFPDIPQWARAEFAESGCAVAQAFYPEAPHNVISGEFARSGQVDWAALCGRADSTQIVVAWAGSERCPMPIATAPNKDYLQGIGNNQIGFSRALNAVSNEAIRILAEGFDGPAPPSIDHAGINDIYVEKASVIHYCHARRWHTLAGID